MAIGDKKLGQIIIDNTGKATYGRTATSGAELMTYTATNSKFQLKLVGTQTTGQNIKTINGTNILGTGNISTANTKYYSHHIYFRSTEIQYDSFNFIIICSKSTVFTDFEDLCSYLYNKYTSSKRFMASGAMTQFGGTSYAISNGLAPSASSLLIDYTESTKILSSVTGFSATVTEM